jgi:hypothetical protein
VVISDHDCDDRIRGIAATITKETIRWAKS